MPKEIPLFLASKNVMSPKFKGDFTRSLKWGIEFTHPKDGVTQLSVIYSFAKEEGVFSCVTFGPLVAVADAGNEIVNLIVENPQEKCWLKLKFSAVCYSIKFNLERVGAGLVSVLGCGLFPSFLKTKDVLGQKGKVPMKAKEFESGFARVARWMPQNDQILEVPEPRTFITRDMMSHHGITIWMGIKQDAEMIYGDSWSLENVGMWARRKKEEYSQAVLKDYVGKTPSVRPKETGKRKGEFVRIEEPENEPAKKAPKKTAAASKRPLKATRPKSDENTIREIVSASQSTEESREKATKRKGKKTQEVPRETPAEAPQSTFAIPRAVPEVTPEDSPAKKAIEKGKEDLDVIKPYYTFGMDKILLISVELITNPMATLVYRPFSMEHAQDIAQSMIKN